MPRFLERPAARYGLALLVAVAALLLRWSIDPYVHDRVPFAFVTLGVVLVSALAGFGPGLLTLISGSLATIWLFLTPRYSLATGTAHQISIAATITLGLMICYVGECLRRARNRARAYEEILSDDFQHTGEVFVSTLGGVRSAGDKSPFSDNHPEIGSLPLAGPLGRIISDAIPRIPETVNAPNWQVLANGVPVVNVEVVRDGLPGDAGSTRKWVVTHFNPNVGSPKTRVFGTVVKEFYVLDWS